MTNVGWIGLGAMGSPMASFVAKAGHTVTAFDIDPQKAAALAGDGVKTAATISTSTWASAAASPMVAAALTPSPARVTAFCGSISKAVTVCPAFATNDAMGEPMAPRPIHPTLVISAVSFYE